MSNKLNSSTYIENIPPRIWQTLCLGVSILVFILILVNRSPFLLRPVSMALRLGFGMVIPLAGLVMYAAFRIPGRYGELFALTATMALFALGLAGLWASGNTQSVVLNGLIPLTDAVGYYTDATRLQYGVDVSNFTAMRPFFAGLLSFFLRLTGRNLMVTVGIFTAIAGFASYLASREIQKTHGTELAVFFLILTFLYYRHHSGTTMSESLGVSVSLLGIALIWKGLADQKEWLTLFGVGVIALALNIRPGAMFVLPALLLWGGWIFRGQGKFSYKFFLWGSAIILFVFYANNKMIDFVAGPSGVAFENFSWAFYGLAAGGRSWRYVFEAQPNAKDSAEIYRLAFELIRNNPSLIISGALFYWKMFFSSTWYNAYAFVAGENYLVNEIARWGMYILSALGIFKWFRNFRDATASLAVLGALGVLASVPFVPPTDAYRVRLYAATIPFFILLPGMGLSFLQEKMPVNFLKPHLKSTPGNFPLATISASLVVLLLTAPIYTKTTGALPTPPETVCPPNTDTFFASFDKGTSINIHRENEVFLDWMPDFHISGFRRNAHSLPEISLTIIMESIRPSNTLFYTIDLQTNQQSFVIIETEMLPQPGSLMQVCGELVFDAEVSSYSFFYVDEVLSVWKP